MARRLDTGLQRSRLLGVKEAHAADPLMATREQFAMAFYRLSQVKKAAEEVGISEAVARAWFKEPWFKRSIEHLRMSFDAQMDGRITRILDKALGEIEDRLDKGDEKIVKYKDHHETVRVAVGAQTLAVMTGVLYDKREKLRKLGAPMDETDDHLDRIAEKLRRGYQPAPADIEDVTPKEPAADTPGAEPADDAEPSDDDFADLE